MLNKEAVQIIKPLLDKYGHNPETYGTLVAEALKEGVLEELLDVLYETKMSDKISPSIVFEQLNKYYLEKISSPKEKSQQANTINHLINKHQCLLMKTTFDDKK